MPSVTQGTPLTDKPRKHPFVPQFWIRKFAGPDGKLWAYDHRTDQIREHSSKQLMQIFNLYTIEPSGADDTTLETVDHSTNGDGPIIGDRVLYPATESLRCVICDGCPGGI